MCKREIMRLDQEIKYREARAREEGHAAGLSEGHAAGADSKAKDIAANTGVSEEEISRF